MNSTGRGRMESRCAGVEKLAQLPVPNKNPKITNPRITRILMVVSVFWIFATLATPKQLRIVNAAMSSEASNCGAPNFSENAAEPMVSALDGSNCLGKKKPTQLAKTSAAVAIGAENPAKNET